MGEVSVDENGLAPVYIRGSHTPALSLASSSSKYVRKGRRRSDLITISCGISSTILFTLIFITIALVPDSSPNRNQTHPANLDRQSEARPVSHIEDLESRTG